MPRPVEGEIKMLQGLKNKAMLSKVTRKEMQFYVDQFYSKKEG